MKNAILISGRPGSGKTLLAHRVRQSFKKAGTLLPQEPRTSWLAPGTDLVLVDGVTSTADLDRFLKLVTSPAIRIRKKGRAPYELSPFFVFSSQRVRLLPDQLLRHFAHIDCYRGGMCLVSVDGLPEKVLGAVHGHAEKLCRAGRLADRNRDI